MAIKTILSKNEVVDIVNQYEIGNLIDFESIETGSVETNYVINTDMGKYVLRYYEKRTISQVEFEREVIDYLISCSFPTPKIISPKSGNICTYKNKPFILFEFIIGCHIEKLNEIQKINLIGLIAQLNNLTRDKVFSNYANRLTYDPTNCRKLAYEKANIIDTENARAKLRWYLEELKKLELPDSLPKSICHSDYYHTNILFNGDQINALIDFDDANYTYCYFDILSVINFFIPQFNHDTWMNFDSKEKIVDFTEARKYLKIYTQISPIREQDKTYMYDILKLGILVDCIWYFERGETGDFFEKRKIDALNKLGRTAFYDQLFN